MAESRRYFSEIMNMDAVNEMDTEADDEEKARIYKEPMRRNLLDVFDKEMPIEVADERMSVFLRVRPFSTHELENEENQGCVEVQSNYMVSANAPRDSHTFKAQLYGLNKAKHNFTFSRVFPESTSQKMFFDSTMLKLVQDFIEGQNCLVFTYGVTNSGKTYTIQGNARDAGILPRGLDVLFNSINGKQWPGMDLKPRMFCDVVKLSPEEEDKERKIKERTLKLNCSEDLDVMTLLGDDASDQSVMNATGQSDSSTSDRKGSVDSQELMAELENRDREETAVDVTVQGQICFSVWVSFAEIYNEQIFDLLEPIPKKKDARRPVLKLSEDRRGSPYIKGLKEINVTSADEAYKLLTIGQRNLKTACTRLNHCSSRSHCIFNIKIIRVPDKGNPQMARVSMLSLCDLAGSERHSKTHTTGERLKEAGNINTSLLTLGRCIELLRYNQHHKEKENKIIPFRDSRLTRLFQNFFCGRGKAAMIVNVSQCASMFDETLNVFKFSAIAKQVVMPPKPVEKPAEVKPKRKSKTEAKSTARASSICWETSATPSGPNRQSNLMGETVAEEDEEEDMEEDSEDDDAYILELEDKVKELKTKIKQMKCEQLGREVQIRKEVCEELQKQFVQIEDMYSTMLEDTKQLEAEKFEKKLKLLMDHYQSHPQPSKRPRLEGSASVSGKMVMVDDEDEWVSSILLHQEKVKVQEKEASLAEMRGQISHLEFQLADTNRKNKDISDKALKAKQAQEEAERECAEKVALAEASARRDASKAGDDIGQSVLLETLGQQLQESKDRLKQQEKEIADLNEMLTDAGETFQQKEADIAKLKQVIAEDEEKAESQLETIRQLRAMLEESKAAVDDAERRIQAKNDSIGAMKEELAELDRRLNEDRKDINPHDALKKCEEELAIAQNRLKHEEEDFQQRQKALIHGYTAEINNLKSQMALLKSRNLGKCVATSPMRSATPEKSKSPTRSRLRRLAGGDGGKGKKRKGVDADESFSVDLVHQLKEMTRIISLPAELRQKLQDAGQSAAVLQQQVEERGELEARLQQTQHDLQELQAQFSQLSSASSQLHRQLDNKKELHTELTDNQSESAELRQKLRIAESSTEDMEARLAAASEQKLAAEASKAEVLVELREKKNTLEQLEIKVKQYESELADLQKAMQSMTDTNNQLTTQCESYKMMTDAQHAKMEAAAEEQEALLETVKTLKKELSEMQMKAEKAKEKTEELQLVSTELRTMLNQTTAELEIKSTQLKIFEQKAGEEMSSNETLLKSALSEANDMLQQRTVQCETLKTQLKDFKVLINELQTTVQECETREADLKTIVDTKEEVFQAQSNRMDSHVKEIEALKAETASALMTSQASVKQIELLQTELHEKKSHVETLELEINKLQESHRQTVEELTDNINRLQSIVDDNLTSSDGILHEKEILIKDLETRTESLEAQLQEKEKEVSDLTQNIQSVQSEIAEKEKLLSGMTDAEENANKELSELKEQLNKFSTEKQTSDELCEKLQGQVTDAETRIQELQEEMEYLRATKEHTDTALAEQQRLQSEMEKDLQSKNQVLEDLKQKESARLQKLQCLEKAQKEAKRLHEKKLTEAKEALMSKEREVEELKASFSQLSEQSSQAGALQTQMSEATMEIAELRSKLHMEKALTQKHKTNVEEIHAENNELETRIQSVTQELEKMQKEKANLTEELGSLKARVSDLESVNTETTKNYDRQFSDHKASIEALTTELQAANQSKETLQQADDKTRTEIQNLEEKLRQLETEREKWETSYQKMKTDLDKAQIKISNLEECRSKLEEQLASQVSAGHREIIPDSDTTELKLELETEKSRNSELQKQIRALTSIDSAIDAPGSSRRLRKEKIQAESDLANARFEADKLQKQVEKLLNSKETNSPVLSSSFKCASCIANKTQSEHSSSDGIETLRQSLSKKTDQLHKVETVCQRLECELLEVKAKLMNTETELKELQVKQYDASTCQKEPQKLLSVSATSQQREAYNILHEELEKSQKREANLRKELQACASMVDNDRLTQLEEQLAQKTSELQQALHREKERRNLSLLKEESVPGEQLQQQVTTLTAQLEAKEQALQDKRQRLTDIQAELQRAQQQRKIAVEDVKANEQVIQQLKDAMMEQEETMEKQDAVISHKDEEIQSLVAELDKANSRCTQLQNQDAESSRELRNLTRQHVRLEEEKKHLSRDYGTLEQKMQQLTEEKRQLQDQLTETKTELSRLQESVNERGKSSMSLQDKLAATEKELSKVKRAYEKDTQIRLATEDEREALKDRVKALELKVKDLEDRRQKMDEEKQKLEQEMKEKEVVHKAGEEERQRWREQKDQLCADWNNMLKKRDNENENLKAQLQDDKDHYGKLLDQERREKQELKRQLKTLQRAKDSMLSDLRHSNHQLQVELALAQGHDPPPSLPPAQHYSFRVNDSDLVDDIDTTGHLELDATPPVAAKSLRKGRKRSSTLSRTDSTAGKSRRKPRVKPESGMEVVQEAPESVEKCTMSSHLQELEEKNVSSPLTRSAKKLLRLISPERTSKTKADQENTPDVMEEVRRKRGRQKKEDIPPPFECAPFQPAGMETRKSSRLRERRQTTKQQSVV